MPRDAADVLREALELSAESRAALADSLLSSLDESADPDAEQRWGDEVRRRVEEVDEGAVKLIDWEEARRRLRSHQHR